MRPLNLLGMAIAGVIACSAAQGQDAASMPILFTNVNVFDGVNEQLIENANVVVTGNLITEISTEPLAVAGGTVIDGGGRTMIPGLIDAHWHSAFATIPQAALLNADEGYIQIHAALGNEQALMRGFTSVRDVGGNVFGLKRATDEGTVAGPRIYPSGAYISQTAGHGDFRGPNEVPTHPGAPLGTYEVRGHTLIADGVPEVIKRTREVLRMGASQVKMMAGGGVSSLYDPLDTTQYTYEEMKAIVDVAKTWNTYVTIHANTDAAIQQAIEAGVQCVEHAFLVSDETVKMAAERGVWLSLEPILDDEDAIPFPDPVSRAKFVAVTNGTDNVYNLAKQYGAKVAWGTDTLFDPALAAKQGKMVAKLSRWYTPAEILKMVTHDNAELLKLSGPRDPYPGKLGVIKEGALADLLLIDGNPLQNIMLVADPEANFDLIMKDGVVYKNTLGE